MNKLTKKLSILFASFAMAMGVGLVGGAKSANADSGSAIYTIATKTSVTQTGTAPASSSASYSQTYTTAGQMTRGKSTTLTLSGYDGYKITAITLNMKSNASKGAGTFSATAGSTTLASIASATTFNKWYDNTSYGSSYRDIHVTMDNASYAIGTGETVTILITGTTNSIYIQSYTIAWESAGPSTVDVTNVAVDPDTLNILSTDTSAQTVNVTVTPSNATNQKVTITSSGDDVATISATELTATDGTASFTVTGKGATSGTQTVTVTTDDQGKTATLTINAVDASKPVLQSITVGGTATHPTQFVGNNFDPDGLTFTPVYDKTNDNPETITGDMISWDALVAGQAVTGTYEGIDVTVPTSLVTVKNDSITSVRIDGDFTTKTYDEGANWNTNGLTVYVKHESTGDAETEVTNGITWSFNPATATLGTQTVTVKATVDGVESAAIDVTGIIVNEKTSIGGIKSGKKYFITAGGAVLKAGTFASGQSKTYTATYDASTLTEADAWIFTAGSADNTWNISTADGSSLYHTSTNNGVVSAANKSSEVFTVSYADESAGTLYLVNNSRYLTYYSGTPNFRCYTNTSNGVPQITLVEYVPAVLTTGIELDKDTLVFESPDAEAQTLTATISPSDAVYKDVTWASNNNDVATVSNGVVTPVGVGSAEITATVKESASSSVTYEAKCTVTVKEPVKLELSAEKTVLSLNESVNITYTLTGTDAAAILADTANLTLDWKSSASTIISVDSNGTATALAVGDATITLTINGKYSASIDLEAHTSVVSVEDVTLTPASTTLATGETVQLVATITPADATNTEVTWSTTDEEIASVSTTGLVTAGTKSGTATITVETVDGNKTANAEIIVNNAVQGISLNKNTLSLTAGNSEQLVATITPEYATNKSVTWSSSKPTVADVDQDGNVTAKDKAGTAVITVTTADGNFSAECTVTVTKESGYILVTDASTIKAGDIIRLGASTSSKSYAAGAISGSNKFMSTTDATITDGKLVSDNAIDLVVGGEEGAWTLSYNGELLCATANKSVIFGDGTSGTSTWTISIDASGNATISSTTSSYGRLLVNVGATRVVNYSTSTSTSSTMLLPQIYRQTAALNNDEAFVKAVNDIGTVTIDSGTAIENAKTLYAKLDAEDLALESVIAAKATLDAKEAEYNALVADKAVADEVVSKIDAIGEVTKDNYESKITAIEEAEAAYAKLTDSQKSFVTNYSTLTAARDAYDEISSAKDKANEVIDLIDAIGDVTMDNFSDKITAIEKAETAYAGLTDLQKEFVTNYSTLTSARESYDSYSQVQDVIDAIDAIGEITKDNYESKLTEIEAAEEAYAKLTAEQDKLVTNYDVLEAARNRHDALVAAKSEADTLIGFINEYDVDTITYDDKGHIEALRDLYEEHKGTDVDLFITDEHIAKIEALEAKMTKLTNAHDFVTEWSQMRTNGGETGICGYLTDSENSTLAALLNKFAAFDAETQKLIRAETDVIYGETTVTIGETMDYMASVRDWVKNIVTPTSSELNGIVLTTNTESNSLVALFAIVGLVAVSAYYFLEKKKLSK